MTTPSGTSDFRLEPIMKELGAYIGGDKSTAYFENGELRLEPGGPEAPKLLSWCEPVWDGQLADELEVARLLISTPPLSLSGSSFPEADGFGWRMVEAEGVHQRGSPAPSARTDLQKNRSREARLASRESVLARDSSAPKMMPYSPKTRHEDSMTPHRGGALLVLMPSWEG